MRLSSDKKELTLQGLHFDRVAALREGDQTEWIKQHLPVVNKYKEGQNSINETLGNVWWRIRCADITVFDGTSRESSWKPTSHGDLEKAVDKQYEEYKKGSSDQVGDIMYSIAQKSARKEIIITRGR